MNTSPSRKSQTQAQTASRPSAKATLPLGARGYETAATSSPSRKSLTTTATGAPVGASPSRKSQTVAASHSDHSTYTTRDFLDDGANVMGRRSSFDPKSMLPERVNAQIAKRYIIDNNEIGSGGYGKVFLARDREMNQRTVAIKKVIVFDEQKRCAFKKEVAIMKELDHPNICRLLETYEQGRFMFFVMEYCQGGEVFDRIMDRGMIDEETTAGIVKQAASALKYAHNRGIAHRDMKPENICFCTDDVNDDQVKVIDWGLGFYFGQARMKSAVGSLTYAAPEVLEARDVAGYTSACDQWSLGVVTYVMLCGKPPFWGNYQDQLSRMKKESFPMSDSTWSAISDQAKNLIRALLRNNPKDRLPLSEVLAHPWLKNPRGKMDAAVSKQVLSNLKQFSKTSQFFSLCVASVARQLDHQSLRDVHRLFCELDTNGDGVLELKEVRAGFENIFGKGSEQLKDVEAIFSRLDLDGSGTIDYTEFCAAGIGERLCAEEHVLWAAFKAFDIQDDDGKVTKEEIKQVLRRADVNKVWTDEVCDEMATELVQRFDENGDGSLDFDEWLRLMRSIASRTDDGNHKQESHLLDGVRKSEKGLAQLDKAYNMLVELDSPRRSRAPPGGRIEAPAHSAKAKGAASRTACCSGLRVYADRCVVM